MQRRKTASTIMELFLEEKQAENLSESTLRLYRIHIADYIASLDDDSAASLSLSSYQRYVVELQDDDEKRDVTVTSYCRSIRAFLYWAQAEGYIEQFQIKLPRYQKTIKRCYTDEEMKKLLAAPDEKCQETEYLCYIFVNLAAATGLRLSSLLALRVRDIEGDGWLYVDKTKSRRGQKIKLNPNIQKLLRKYIAEFALNKDDFLFANGDGRPYHKCTMSHMIYEYNIERGVEQTGVHRFRHTFARNYYRQTHDAYGLSKILGHAAVTTTEAYLRDLGEEDYYTEMTYNPQQQFAAKHTRRGRMRS